MLSLEQILNSPPPRPVLSGAHCEIAEGYRQEALLASARLRVFAEVLDFDLRERPDDDAAADTAITELAASVRAAVAWIDAFRATRIIDGTA